MLCEGRTLCGVSQPRDGAPQSFLYTMLLNGKELVLGEQDAIPEFTGVTMEGTVEVAPGGCTFFVL